jgi:hypothetical protein
VLLCALDQVRAKAISEGKSRRGAFIAFESPPNPGPIYHVLVVASSAVWYGPAWDIVSIDLKERFAKSEIDKTEFEEKRRLILESQASVRHDR